MKNDTYYRGFEGEPEIQIILRRCDSDYILSIWEGYFDTIMMSIPATKSGWLGIVCHYHLCDAWNEESMWCVDDNEGTYNILKSVPKEKLDKTSISVLDEICDLFFESISKKCVVIIHRE